jgi:uncharacterized protein with HEPN domain
MKSDKVYLLHIVDALNRIGTYTENISFQAFADNQMLQDALIRQLEIIGEASRKLSKEFRDTTSTIPWKEMIGMRDKLIHDYMGVDIEEVWYTVQQDVPELKRLMENQPTLQ